jgi:hypothetical protein
MTKTDLPYNTAGDLRPAGDPAPARDDSTNYMGDVLLCFCHYFFKNYPQDLKCKNSPERHASRFSNICAKNQALN